MKVLKAEVEHGTHLSLRTDDTAQQAAIKKRFEIQFRAYARNDHPFNSISRTAEQTTLQWWTIMSRVQGTDVLAVSPNIV